MATDTLRLRLMQGDTVRHYFDSYGSDHKSPTSGAVIYLCGTSPMRAVRLSRELIGSRDTATSARNSALRRTDVRHPFA
jgi:hypothetical protein